MSKHQKKLACAKPLACIIDVGAERAQLAGLRAVEVAVLPGHALLAAASPHTSKRSTRTRLGVSHSYVHNIDDDDDEAQEEVCSDQFGVFVKRFCVRQNADRNSGTSVCLREV